MASSSVVVIASNGPFGPTLTGVLMLLALLVMPFVLAAIAARSLFGSDPISWWLVAILWSGALTSAYILWEFRMDRHWSGFWGVWRMFGIAAVMLSPVVLFMEAGKRDFFRRTARLKKPATKPRKTTRERDRPPDGPPHSHGVFVSDDS